MEAMSQVQTDVSRGGSICQAVVEAIAEAEGSDPVELTPPLYQVIDPDSLESLFDNKQALGKVVFNYNSYQVSVFTDEYVSVKSNSM